MLSTVYKVYAGIINDRLKKSIEEKTIPIHRQDSEKAEEQWTIIHPAARG